MGFLHFNLLLKSNLFGIKNNTTWTRRVGDAKKKDLNLKPSFLTSLAPEGEINQRFFLVLAKRQKVILCVQNRVRTIKKSNVILKTKSVFAQPLGSNQKSIVTYNFLSIFQNYNNLQKTNYLSNQILYKKINKQYQEFCSTIQLLTKNQNIHPNQTTKLAPAYAQGNVASERQAWLFYTKLQPKLQLSIKSTNVGWFISSPLYTWEKRNKQSAFTPQNIQHLNNNLINQKSLLRSKTSSRRKIAKQPHFNIFEKILTDVKLTNLRNNNTLDYAENYQNRYFVTRRVGEAKKKFLNSLIIQKNHDQTPEEEKSIYTQSSSSPLHAFSILSRNNTNTFSDYLTYYFLQTILAKYLDTYFYSHYQIKSDALYKQPSIEKTMSHKYLFQRLPLLNTSRYSGQNQGNVNKKLSMDEDYSVLTNLYLKLLPDIYFSTIKKKSTNTLHFLSNFSGQSFLTYWLLPLSSLAFFLFPSNYQTAKERWDSALNSPHCFFITEQWISRNINVPNKKDPKSLTLNGDVSVSNTSSLNLTTASFDPKSWRSQIKQRSLVPFVSEVKKTKKAEPKLSDKSEMLWAKENNVVIAKPFVQKQFINNTSNFITLTKTQILPDFFSFKINTTSLSTSFYRNSELKKLFMDSKKTFYFKNKFGLLAPSIEIEQALGNNEESTDLKINKNLKPELKVLRKNKKFNSLDINTFNPSEGSGHRRIFMSADSNQLKPQLNLIINNEVYLGQPITHTKNNYLNLDLLAAAKYVNPRKTSSIFTLKYIQAPETERTNLYSGQPRNTSISKNYYVLHYFLPQLKQTVKEFMQVFGWFDLNIKDKFNFTHPIFLKTKLFNVRYEKNGSNFRLDNHLKTIQALDTSDWLMNPSLRYLTPAEAEGEHRNWVGYNMFNHKLSKNDDVILSKLKMKELNGIKNNAHSKTEGSASTYPNELKNLNFYRLNGFLRTTLTHKKMFKKVYYKNNQQVPEEFHELIRPYSGVNIKPFGSNKQQIQKKRKAKKNRLETRRQKKRTRLYPRPIWLRYRMFLNLIKHRLKVPSYSAITKVKPSRDFPKLVGLSDSKKIKFQRSSKFVRLKNLQPPIVSFSGPEVSLCTGISPQPIQGLEIDKKPITEAANITNYKNQATYVNFTQNTNNAQNLPNNQEKNTLFRDFWISAYNNTSPLFTSANPFGNILQHNLWWFLPINTTFVNSKSCDHKKRAFSLDAVYSKERRSAERLNEQHPLLNELFTTNHFDFLQAHPFAPKVQPFGSKSLQSLTNETNSISIQNYTKIFWALNKTNLNLQNIKSKRLSLWGVQKLRNQSKNNKTKFLEKQLSNKFQSIVLNQSLNNFYKKIKIKINQKKEKLNYLTLVQNLGPNNQVKDLKPRSFLPRGTRGKTTWEAKGEESRGLTISAQNKLNFQSFGQKVFHIQLFNNAWWDRFCLTNMSYPKHTESQTILVIPSREQPQLNQNSDIQQQGRSLTVSLPYADAGTSLVVYNQLKPGLKLIINPATKILSKNPKTQIKDHLLLSSDSIKSRLQELGTSMQVTQSNSHFALNKFSVFDNPSGQFVITDSFAMRSSSVFLHICFLITLVTISQVRCVIKFYLILFYKVSNLYKALLDQTPYSVFMQNTQPTLHKHVYHALTNKAKAPIEMKLSLVTFSLLLLKPPYVSDVVNHYLLNDRYTFWSKDTIMNFKAEVVAAHCPSVFDPQDETPWKNLALNSSRTHIGSNKYLRSFNQMFKPANLLTENASSKVNIKDTLTRRVVEDKSTQNKHTVYIQQTKLSLKKTLIQALFTSKKQFRKMTFTLVDLFQIVYGNISKLLIQPTEFTTTWIAYGFLIEWSSDLLTIIPENVDIYTWNHFSKMTRPIIFVTPILFDQKNAVILYAHDFLIHNKINYFLTNLVKPIDYYQFYASSFIKITSLLTFSHLIHRRINYLVKTLIFTITQPDTDLIYKQKKGSLFWDIWADILITAADYYNVNVAALSTIKAEQDKLMDKLYTTDSYMLAQQFKLPSKTISDSKGLYLTLYTEKQLKDKRTSKKHGYLSAWNLKSNNKSVSAFSPPMVSQVLNQRWEIYKNLKPKLKVLINSQACPCIRTGQRINNVQPSVKTRLWDLIRKNKFYSNTDRWEVNQYMTYQSWHSHNGSNFSQGDLFIDYYPPKSFVHIPILKYNHVLQQPIANLVCDIYSGIFNKQVAKNILLVNTSSRDSFSNNEQKGTSQEGGDQMDNSSDISQTFGQATFGKNMLNILIQALAGETELKIITDNAQRYALVNRGFAIGIKLLKDVFDAIALNTPCIFLLEDIHKIGERRPLLITDNGGVNDDNNSENFEEFFGTVLNEVHEKNIMEAYATRHKLTDYKKPFKGDYSLAIPTNLYLADLFLKYPMHLTNNFTSTTLRNKIPVKTKTSVNQSSIFKTKTSSLIEVYNQIVLYRKRLKKLTKSFRMDSGKPKLYPTSPFSLLLLKEKNIISPNLVVDEFAWTGLQNLNTKPRTSYSIRAKVLMLAEASLANVSAKLDMITDLLVIIDSVRSNKGFVVFATTNVPHILDPALRRPGRLDETICLPDISSMNLKSYTHNPIKTSLNFVTNYETIKFSNNFLIAYNTNYSLSKPFFLSRNDAATQFSDQISTVMGIPITGLLRNTYLTVNLKDYYTTLKTNQLTFTGKKNILSRSKKNLLLPKVGCFNITHKLMRNIKQPSLPVQVNVSYSVKQAINWYNNQIENNRNKMTADLGGVYPLYKPWVKHLIYSQVGSTLLHYKLNNGYWLGTLTNWNLKTINFWSLHSSKTKVITALMILFAPKITQMLASRTSVVSNNFMSKPPNNHCFIEQNFSLKMATNLLRVFLQKRFLYKQNLIVPSFLNFTNKTVLKEPPSPPLSSLGIPAKRFENYKRVIHQNLVFNKKDFITNIYNQHRLAGKSVNNNLDLSPDEGLSSQPLIGIVKYYQTKLLKRHAQYLTNQWWNGQLSEHNTETVFLSDIDWRSTYIKKDLKKRIIISHKQTLLPSSDLGVTSTTKVDNFEPTLEDILLDFPDSDQYYNPRNRRWLVNKGSWSFWFDLDKVYSEEIIKTMLVESITQTQQYLYNNTELLDFLALAILKAGFLHSRAHNLNTLHEKINSTSMVSAQPFGSKQHPITELNELLVTNILTRWVF